MKHTYLIIGSLAFAAALSACHKKNDKQHEAEGIPSVEVALPEIDSVVLHKTYPGTLYSGSVVDVMARVNGQFIGQSFQGGDHVKAGQLLCTLESTRYADAVKQARASLATAKSEYDYASRHYEAMNKALEVDAVSQMEVIQSKSAMEQAQAAIRNAEATLETALTNLSYCTIRAPQSGTISEAVMNVGNYINGEGAPVKMATIYNNEYLDATFNIEDSQYEKMVGRNGGASGPLYRAMPLKFAEELPHSYTADLHYESPSVNTSTGTILLKGKVKNINDELKNGMYVTVSLPYGVDPKAILVKDASIGTDQLGKYLYVVNDSDKVVLTHIETGDVYRDSLRIVTKGLKPGQRYVTKALLTVRAGEKVKPVLTR